MAVTSKNLRSAQRTVATAPTFRNQFQIGFYVVTLLLVAVALYAIISVCIGQLGVFADDLRYGRPRIDKLEAYVQHGETPGRPTYLMAMNLNRQVTVVEIPGGDAAKTRSFAGPYLFGANEDLTPVTLSLHDMDGDGTPDLLVDVRREQIVYLNRDGTFRLPTAAEQARLQTGTR